ncbi:MAG: IS21 family transposase [Thermodesulfobacteriota bacterium]|nr:IS21 family transposase [Thermodesulfobacteriota bacterium]
MIDRQMVFEVHRLKNMGYSQRKIARELRLGRDTVGRYLKEPDRVYAVNKSRPSKLDAYHELIDQMLEEYPYANAPVILQRIQSEGFDGEISIVRGYLRKKRGQFKSRQAFIRFESPPGRQMQIDWGHFNTLTYGNTKRRLYALVVTEAYSRMLYVEFTHSQRQEALHQGLLSAFKFFGGTPQEVIVDNMLTAVIERQGSVIRYNDAFLDFLRVFGINPKACNVRAPYEKGKVERSIGYIRQNFWPLRSFKDLSDVQAQMRGWLNGTANVRIHQTTGERPFERFDKAALRPLPQMLPDCRETTSVVVHKDFAVQFDGNAYTVPPWSIGKQLTIKADQTAVSIYHKDKLIATHKRCWERKKRIEIPSHQEQVRKLHKRLWQDRQVAMFSSLGTEALDYIEALAGARQPIKKNVIRMLALKDEYGATSLIYAIRKAMEYKAYGADYIENILYQEMTPQKKHPPLKMRNDALNHIQLTEPSLAEYDTYVLKRRHGKDD